MRIRPAEPEDAAAVVALRRLVYPYLVRGVEATRRSITGSQWVAVAGGEVVGWVAARGHTISLLHVHPGHRRRGIGSELLAEALRHVRPPARIFAQPECLEFARRHGFAPSREVRYSALELRDFPRTPSELPRLREVDPVALYRAYAEATADEPGDVPPEPMPYGAWRDEFWDNPDVDAEAGTVAVLDGRPVSFTFLLRDGDRAWSDMTATLPAYRGKGLASAVKRAALSRTGARVAYTSNDAANGPMLAVNARLGYRTVAAQWSCVSEALR